MAEREGCSGVGGQRGESAVHAPEWGGRRSESGGLRMASSEVEVHGSGFCGTSKILVDCEIRSDDSDQRQITVPNLDPSYP